RIMDQARARAVTRVDLCKRRLRIGDCAASQVQQFYLIVLRVDAGNEAGRMYYRRVYLLVEPSPASSRSQVERVFRTVEIDLANVIETVSWIDPEIEAATARLTFKLEQQYRFRRESGGNEFESLFRRRAVVNRLEGEHLA